VLSVLGNLAVLLCRWPRLLFLPPAFAETYLIINSTIFAAFLAILGPPLALIWAMPASVRRPRPAFLRCLGGYVYAVTASTMGDNHVPSRLACCCLPALSPACWLLHVLGPHHSDVISAWTHPPVALIFFPSLPLHQQTAG